MTSGTARGVAALHADDPRRLGRYRLTGRLGSGGMGVVYLGRADDGRPVAVKLVHTGLAEDDEFRQRFRSEVTRARQVPPFCTAEVLGADLDHEPPYLVVEYVDGPSLAEVVEEQGPLSAANLHSVAIGVATALTAIHGAGVIHRDLKPRNVLLAPGSPKVIDFGIARAFDATSQHTLQDQMVGTVAYMAPERFQSAPGTALTPAADVFAWGVVVAYAGTGRTPFHGDSPPATAGRILTQPPHLDGLTEPLRSLVELTLAKDPLARPTARELLDLLLAGGPAPAPRRRRAPRHQQSARRTADEPTSVGGRPTDLTVRPRRSPFTVPRLRRSTAADPHPRPAMPPRTRPPAAPQSARSAAQSEARSAAQSAAQSAAPASVDLSPQVAVGSPPGAPGAVRSVPGGVYPDDLDPDDLDPDDLGADDLGPGDIGFDGRGADGPAPGGRRSVLHRLGTWQWGTLVTATLLLAGVLIGSVLFGTGIQGADLPADAALPGGAGMNGAGNNGAASASVARPAGSAAESPAATPAATGSGPYAPLLARGDAAPTTGGLGPSGGIGVIQDPLNAPGLWVDTKDVPGRASCLTRGTMRVTRTDRGVYRCAGPTRQLVGDHSIAVNTTLETAGSCAAVWFRYAVARGGQVLRVCQDRLVVAVDLRDDRRVLGELPLATPIALGSTTRVLLVVRRDIARVYRDGALVGSVPLHSPLPATAPVGAAPASGQMALGISVDTLTDAPPYAVTFANVDIRTAP